MCNNQNQIDITKDNIAIKYYEKYIDKTNKFLLFDLANANENAHTKVLLYLLKYNNYQFLDSFLERVGLPKRKVSGKVIITDQEEATINSTKKGYIDLYIEYNNTVKIIIENKIYGAADTKEQLLRYIAKVQGRRDFEQFCKNPSINENTYVIYLTADGTKIPSGKSLPEDLRENNNYCPINYQADILAWLEEDVLPNVPYEKDGMMIAGLRQYIASLKKLFIVEKSNVVDSYVNSLNSLNAKEKYKILKDITNTSKIPEDVFNYLKKELDVKMEEIFSNDKIGKAEDGWKIHFTPSFVILYKDAWAKIDTRKYAIPSVYLLGYHNREFYNKDKYKFTHFSARIDHLPPTIKNHLLDKIEDIDFKFTNHNKTFALELSEKQIIVSDEKQQLPYKRKVKDLECKDLNDKDKREEFYSILINGCNDYIYLIDQAVNSVQNTQEQKSTDKSVTQNEREKDDKPQVLVLNSLIDLYKKSKCNNPSSNS